MDALLYFVIGKYCILAEFFNSKRNFVEVITFVLLFTK